MLDDRGSIATRIGLLDTILMDEKQLKILLGYEKDEMQEKDKTYISFYYLLNNISNDNDEGDKRKLYDILSKAKENTDKIKLLEVIVSKAQELISTITKEKKRKDEANKLIKQQEDIEEKKGLILNYINVNDYIDSKDKITFEGVEYSILIKEEIGDSYRGATSITNYYLLYKKHDIYTMKTVWWSSTGNTPLIPPKLLDYDLDLTHLYLLSNLYRDIKYRDIKYRDIESPPSGGKSHHTPTYKSTGVKVLLLIDNKRLHRSVYVKGNGKAKYCKINNEFILLSKLKNKVIE